MGLCCCKDDGYFKFDIKEIERKRRKKTLKEIYKKYSKKKCYICDKIKYGRYRPVVYGEEFICIDCHIDRDKQERQQLY